MRAIKFKQATNNVAENQPQYQTLPAYYGQLGENEKETGLVTCFELTDQEIETVKKYGKIWHSQLTFGERMQPIQMFVCNDFFNPEKDNEKVDPKSTTKINFDKLPEKFRGLSWGNTPATSEIVYINQGGKFLGTIRFSREFQTWDFYLDNFPGDKKFFRTNLPYYSWEQFRLDCERMGINLTYITDEEDE